MFYTITLTNDLALSQMSPVIELTMYIKLGAGCLYDSLRR